MKKLTLEIAKNLNPMFFFKKGIKDISLIQNIGFLQSRCIEIENLKRCIEDRKKMFPSTIKSSVLPNGDIFQYEDSTAKYYLEERIPEMEKEIKQKEKVVKELLDKIAPYYEKIES